MNDLNVVMLTGTLGKDGVIRGSDKQVTSFSIAVDKNSKKDDNGKWSNDTDWIPCVIFRGEDLRKGDRVKIVGTWANNNWTDKKGVKIYDHRVEVEFIRKFKKKQDYKPASTQKHEGQRTNEITAEDLR